MNVIILGVILGMLSLCLVGCDMQNYNNLKSPSECRTFVMYYVFTESGVKAFLLEHPECRGAI